MKHSKRNALTKITMAMTRKTLGATTVAALTTREGNEFGKRVPILTRPAAGNRSVEGWSLSNAGKFLKDAVIWEDAIGAALKINTQIKLRNLRQHNTTQHVPQIMLLESCIAFSWIPPTAALNWDFRSGHPIQFCKFWREIIVFLGRRINKRLESVPYQNCATKLGKVRGTVKRKININPRQILLWFVLSDNNRRFFTVFSQHFTKENVIKKILYFKIIIFII